jgi:hypothetical protein
MTVTRITKWLNLAGTVGFVIGILASLLSGCMHDVTPANTLKLRRSPETPRDASVIIDEQYIAPLGVVAAQGVRLPVGEHRVSVEKNGFFPYDRIVVSDREPIFLDVKLEPIPD